MLWPNGTKTRPNVSSAFGKRKAPTAGASTDHKGTDFTGFSAVKAIAAGQVVQVGTPSGWAGGGVQVWVQHDGYLSRYLHLKAGSPVVKVGQKVAAGQTLGTMGMSGTATGVHLHLEVVVGGVQIDPVPFITERIGGAASLGSKQRKTKTFVNRRPSPDTKRTSSKPGLPAGTVGNFTGWKRGEKVSGNDVWFQGISGDWFWSGGFTSTSTSGLTDLNPKPKPPAKPARPVLRRGSKGDAVKLLQRTLKASYPLYASKLAVDGDFGPATERVVREFQKRAGLVVDGIVGTKTWARLGL